MSQVDEECKANSRSVQGASMKSARRIGQARCDLGIESRIFFFIMFSFINKVYFVACLLALILAKVFGNVTNQIPIDQTITNVF